MSRRRIRVLLAVGLALVVLAGLLVLGFLWQRGSEFERAANLLPSRTLRLTWTDWAGIRDDLGYEAGEVGGAEPIAGFLEKAHARDLAAVSSTAASAVELDAELGLNPLATEWEMLGQGRDGMLLVFKFPDEADFDRLADRFRGAGFDRPGRNAMGGGVWTGGPDVVARLGLTTYELQNVAFLEDERLLVASDSAGYLEASLPVARGDEDGLDLGDLGATLTDPLAAVVFPDDFVCEDLSMAHADEGAQAAAEDLVESVGGVSPLTGYAVALRPDERVRIVFEVESDEQADQDEEARASLAAAEDPGQLVAYPEVFEVTDRAVEGHAVVLDAKAKPEAFPLSNTTHGPVLLASC